MRVHTLVVGIGRLALANSSVPGRYRRSAAQKGMQEGFAYTLQAAYRLDHRDLYIHITTAIFRLHPSMGECLAPLLGGEHRRHGPLSAST
jgi:hypothetical protein